MPAAEVPRSVDVLVAGAGPAGSRLAARLARAGHDVLLVDRAAFPREKACAEYMSPATLELLDRAGVLSAADGAGANPIAGTSVIAPRGSHLTGLFARAGYRPFRAMGMSLPRRILDLLLLDAARAAGARVLERTTVEEVLEEDGRVTGVRLRTAEGARRDVVARVTAGTDGLRSVVARAMGRPRRFAPRRMAFVAHVDGVHGLADTAQMHVSGHGYVGLNPLGGGRANVSLVLQQDQAAHASGRVESFFFEQLDTFPGVRGRVPRTGLAREVLVTGPFHQWARSVTADGALVAGDAADFFDPFTGEGIYCALRGAEMAADVLEEALQTAGPVTRASLAPYARRRRRAFLGKWAVERLIGYAMHAPALFDRAVARLGRRGSMADTLIGVTGDFVPARAVLNPLFLARMIW